MMKAKVTLVEPIDRDPFYSVHYQITEDRGWNIAKVFSFRPDGEGIWGQEKNLSDAMELAKRIESKPGETEIVIYETPSNETDTTN